MQLTASEEPLGPKPRQPEAAVALGGRATTEQERLNYVDALILHLPYLRRF
jgi:hypothetical protein